MERSGGDVRRHACRLFKLQLEHGAFAGLRLHLYVAFVQQHDLLAQVKANAAAVFARAEERDKDLVQ